MLKQRDIHLRWPQVPALLTPVLAVVLVAGVGLSAVGLLAATQGQNNQPRSSTLIASKYASEPSTGNRSPSKALAQDAVLFLAPGAVVGTCPAPANGGTTQVGCTFVLDLFVNAGTNAAPEGLTAQQSYLTFTYQTIQNARVSSIGAGCVPTNTVTADLTVFDATLQNEVCNGPATCIFRGVPTGPGTLAYASGALTNCPEGCPDNSFPNPVFRLAQIGICAAAPGQASLNWQFNNNPPNDRCANGAPQTRTLILG